MAGNRQRRHSPCRGVEVEGQSKLPWGAARVLYLYLAEAGMTGWRKGQRLGQENLRIPMEESDFSQDNGVHLCRMARHVSESWPKLQ